MFGDSSHSVLGKVVELFPSDLVVIAHSVADPFSVTTCFPCEHSFPFSTHCLPRLSRSKSRSPTASPVSDHVDSRSADPSTNDPDDASHQLAVMSPHAQTYNRRSQWKICVDTRKLCRKNRPLNKITQSALPGEPNSQHVVYYIFTVPRPPPTTLCSRWLYIFCHFRCNIALSPLFNR